jgi:hypothetical protein
MEHIFHKIILNIYFDHIYIMCSYKVFSVHYTSYMLVRLMEGERVWQLDLNPVFSDYNPKLVGLTIVKFVWHIRFCFGN